MSGGRRLGIDVGGTKCLGVILDDAGEVLEEQRRPTPKGPEAIIDTLAELARAMGPWESIGIGVPGLVTRDGVLRASPNLVDINDFRVGALLSAELGVTVHVDNDGTCAAAAEWKTGAARGLDDFVMVTLGTGIALNSSTVLGREVNANVTEWAAAFRNNAP
ncbi:MAG: ROK family protein, partial [Ilumatobacteraceae bacterium]